MIVRRVDTGQVKPGQEREYFKLLSEFSEHANRHDGGPITLIRVSSGGPNAGLFHSFSDFDSMESYGSFIDAAVADEDLQASFSKFFDENSPCVPIGSHLLIQLGAFGAREPIDQPGASAIIRNWSVSPGHQSIISENLEKMANLYSDTNGHWNVWEMFGGGQTDGPRVVTAAVFPSMAKLGSFVDDARKNPLVAEMIREAMSVEHAPMMLGSSVVRVIQY